MLRLTTGSESELPTQGRRWVVSSTDLRARGLRSPQGFSFRFGESGDNFFWTSNEFAAYLFYKRTGFATHEVVEDFSNRRQRENYLYKLSSATTSDIQLKAPAGCEYRPHQKAGIEYCLNAGNVLVADEMRIGKTMIAIGVINNTEARKILITCPKTAKMGWEEELKKWLVKDLKIQILGARTPLDKTADVYIANYDILHIQTQLLEIEFDIIIPDECHLVSRAEARRTRFFLALKGKKIIGLSGTPLVNNPKDLLTIAQWIDPFWKKFVHRNNKFITESGISLTLEEIQETMRSSILIRRVQAQVFEGEPVETRVVPVAPSAVVKPFVEMELRGIEDQSRVRRVLGLHKVPYALSYIDTYTSDGEKLVVFAHHKDVIARLMASLGTKAVRIDGDTSEPEREVSKKRFNTDPKCQVMVGSIHAASMALNLSIASHVVFVECDWSNWVMDQARERCSDQLQNRQVLIEYLVFADSLDHRILTRVDYKNLISSRGIDVVKAAASAQ